MSDSYIDHIPSKERENIRKRMRSPEAYEKLREKVKGPEDLEREMERNESLAEIRFKIESQPESQDMLRESIADDMKEQGIEALIEGDISPEAKATVERGEFRVAVIEHPVTKEDQLAIVPEGNVQEQLPLKPQMSERYASRIIKS